MTGGGARILVIAEWLGDAMTDEQAHRLMDEIKVLSSFDKAELLLLVPESKLYRLLDEHCKGADGISHQIY